MIIITGAAGAIGTSLIQKLTNEGYHDLVLVDESSAEHVQKQLKSNQYARQVTPDSFPEWLRNEQLHVQFVFHLHNDLPGETNLDYQKTLWNICVEFGLPIIYPASSQFDNWAQQQERKPFFWAGIRFSDQSDSIISETADLLYAMMHRRKDPGIYNQQGEKEFS